MIYEFQDVETGEVVELSFAMKDAPCIGEVIEQDGKPYLRAVTAVPVVMEKCIMCHAHYADAKKGEPIGAISYTVPIE